MSQLPAQTKPDAVMLVALKAGTVSPTEWIRSLEMEMLARSQTVVKVDSAEDQQKAVEAQHGLARYLRKIQEAETKAKEPLNQLRKKIGDLCKELSARAEAEGNRLGAMVSQFQIEEKLRQGAARRLADESASALEKERDRLLSQAKSLPEIETIQNEFRDQLAAEAKPVLPIARSNGQVVREEWEIEIFDLITLFRAHPFCCKITPVISEIKQLLDMGIDVHGVRAKKVTKSGVRLKKETYIDAAAS